MVGLSVAVVVFGASVWRAPIQAGADQISSTRAQIQNLQTEAVAGAVRIRDLTVAYEQANTRAAALQQAVAADQANLDRLQQAATATASALRAGAIMSYTGATASTPSGPAGSDDPAVRAEYLQVAVGNLSDTVDQYRTQEAQVASAQATLTKETRASQDALAATEEARRAALTSASQVQSQLVAVQGQLQRLEAAQAAAQAAAAARAAAAAAAARAATQGLPVNGGLVSVVQSVVSPAGGGGNTAGDWLRLRECESGDNYQANTGNGYYGAYQFSEQTWTGLGYPGRPDLEPPAMQDQAAQRLQAQSGWGQWPACSAALGLR